MSRKKHDLIIKACNHNKLSKLIHFTDFSYLTIWCYDCWILSIVYIVINVEKPHQKTSTVFEWSS